MATYYFDGATTHTTFVPGESNARAVTGDEPSDAPRLDSLNPATHGRGGGFFTVHCFGAAFTPDAVVTFDGEDQATTVNSDADVEIDLNLPPAQTPRTVPVTVRCPTGTTAALPFTIT